MGKIKTDYLETLPESNEQQLSLFKVAQATLTKDPQFEQLLAEIRAEAAEFMAIAHELFPGHQHERLKDFPLEQHRTICKEYYRRYPEKVLPPVHHEPEPCKKGWYKVFTVRWQNPYTEPPKGLPRELLRYVSESSHPTVNQQKKIDAILVRIPGYCFGVTTLEHDHIVEARKWSEERKIKNRLRLLEQRLWKKYTIPELYEEALQAALAKNPEYYGIQPLNLPLKLPTVRGRSASESD
ncbi:hypothetical protein ACQ4M3_00885 [Leptolyngbya sp. AN03gr2]|uniref:hypothetical protein n=1 Tax=unclassified Leptolyngbya TaxID=2650499 RepID=UPI003D31FD5F